MIDERRKSNTKFEELNNFLSIHLQKIYIKMKIKTAIILCAGYGKRLHPITLEVPKPLIKIKNKSLLLNTIELVANLGIKKLN